MGWRDLHSRATLSRTLAVLQDYDNHKNVYKPDVRRSKLLEHNENEFKVYLQFYRKSIIAVVINANFDVHYTMSGPVRALSQSYSTRIAEVENPDKPSERELPVGNDHGYVWRLDNYWRIEPRARFGLLPLKNSAQVPASVAPVSPV